MIVADAIERTEQQIGCFRLVGIVCVVRHNKHNNKWKGQLTSLYEMSSLGCSPVLFIGPGMTTRKFEFRTCAPGECCLCPR